MKKEGEKLEALTTYNFRAFDQYLDTFKEANPKYLEQDQKEFESEFYSTFLKHSPYLVLDLVIKRTDKELTEFPQDPATPIYI